MTKTHKDRYYVKPVALEYTYYLNDEVSDESDYQILYEMLSQATENDTVIIKIGNFGGCLHTCISIVNAIRSCKAETVGVLTSVAYSAAGAIFLSCNSYEVRDHCGLMAHDAIGGNYGSLSKQAQRIEHDREMLRSLYSDVYADFADPDEIEKILTDDDLWLTRDDIVQRLSKKIELQEQRFQSQIEEQIADDPTAEELNTLRKSEIITLMTTTEKSVYEKLISEAKKKRNNA